MILGSQENYSREPGNNYWEPGKNLEMIPRIRETTPGNWETNLWNHFLERGGREGGGKDRGRREGQYKKELNESKLCTA